MGQQSARMFFQGKDHKDIWFDGHYHDKMYQGSQLLWEKIGLSFQFQKVEGTFLKNALVNPICGDNLLMYCIGKQIYTSSNGMDWQRQNDAAFDIYHYHSFYFKPYFYLHLLTGSAKLDGAKLYRTKDGTDLELLDRFTFHTGDFSISAGEAISGSGCSIDVVEVIGNGYCLVKAAAYKADAKEYYDSTDGLFLTKDFRAFKNVSRGYGLDRTKVPPKIDLLYTKHISNIFLDENNSWHFIGYVYAEPSLWNPGSFRFYQTTDFLYCQEEELEVPFSLYEIGKWARVGHNRFTADFVETRSGIPCYQKESEVYPYEKISDHNKEMAAFCSRVESGKNKVVVTNYEGTKLMAVIDKIPVMPKPEEIGLVSWVHVMDQQILALCSTAYMAEYLLTINYRR